MRSSQTLYEVLGVEPAVGLAELQAAYRLRFRSLETARGSMSAQAFDERMQLLRLALSTLADPASRLVYDTKLAARRAAATEPMPLVPLVAEPAAVTTVRADALSLRADALSLRADAMLLRAGVDADEADAAAVARTVAGGTISALKYFVRAVGLLVLTAMVAFSVVRCASGGSAARNAKLEAQANEKAALQEYFQAHGVRPANMAELELLEAERRRQENEARSAAQDRDKAEREARQFDEDSRRRADEVSERLRRAEDQARREAHEEQMRKQYEAQAQRAKEEAEQRRVERQQNQWREILRR